MNESILRRFQAWYNRESGKNYVYRKPVDVIPNAGAASSSELSLFEEGAPDKRIAVEFGELIITDDTRDRFAFWQKIMPEMGRDLEAMGIPGEFAVHLSKFVFTPEEVEAFRPVFAAVVADRRKIIEGNTFADIGEYMADKFPAWPRLPSLDMIEFHQWGIYGRPDEMLVQKSPVPLAGKMTLLVSPTDVFKFEGGKISAVERLKAAKVCGTAKGILLFTGKLPADADIIKRSLPLMKHELLSGADEVYVVGAGDSNIRKID